MSDWIIISVSLNLFATLLLTTVYSIIYFKDRTLHVKYWAYAWGFCSFRFIMMFAFIQNGLNALLVLSQITALLSVFFLIKGTTRFLNQKFSILYFISLWPIVIWIIASSYLKISFLWHTFPAFMYIGFTFIIHGVSLLKQNTKQFKTLYSILGWTFILWGLHKLDYPILRTIPMAAVWGYSIALVFTFIVAVCITLAYYESSKQRANASERKYKTYVETAPYGIFVVNRDGKCIDVNAKASSITNYSKEELLNLSIFDLIDDNSPKNKFEQIFKEGNNLNPPILKFVKKDQSTFSGTITAVQIGTDSFLGFLNDITELEKAQNEKNSMQEQLIHSAKLASIGELAAGVGHEINNPLTIISSYLEIIKDKIKKNEYDDLLEMLNTQEQAATRIKTIVNGLRTLARSDSDIIETIEINQSIKNIITILQVLYEKSGIIVTTDLSSQEIFIDGNQSKFQQVIVNLLSNAKDALHTRTYKKISIETTVDNGMGIIIISDNGVGISEKNIDRIYDSFYTTKKYDDGTGLGLSIVRTIIKNICGEIEVKSLPGYGTSFRIFIPLSHNSQLDSSITEKEIDFKPLSGNVLVVDDEEDIRDILINHLEDFGLTVDSAENGQVALDKLYHNHYDVILTDINMPVMGGNELIRKTTKIDGFNSKIFIITGAVKVRSIDVPISGIIPKPFDKEQIYRSLHTCLK